MLLVVSYALSFLNVIQIQQHEGFSQMLKWCKVKDGLNGKSCMWAYFKKRRREKRQCALVGRAPHKLTVKSEMYEGV